MHLIEAEQYYQELIKRLAEATDRIVLAAMIVHVDTKTGPIFEAVAAALERGVTVQILTDVYYKVSRPKGMTAKQFTSITAKTAATLQALQQQGAEVWVVGKLGLNPTKRRCHIKIAVIDDHVYCFGGVNLNQTSFVNVDYMLYRNDAALGETLSDLVRHIGEVSALTDFEHPVSKDSSVLFDAGIPGQSVIYNRACLLAQNAARVYTVSQMVPSGRLARALRRMENHNYFNRPAQAASLLTGALFVDKIRYRIKNQYRGTNYVHAKFMLFELKDGSKALISGSHNFSWRGVAYGTKEIALYSTDVKLWNDLYAFMQRRIVDKANHAAYA